MGKTYSLFGADAGTGAYYATIKALVDRLIELCPDEKSLYAQLQAMGDRSLKGRLKGKRIDKGVGAFLNRVLREKLSSYTGGVKEHLKSLSIRDRFDDIIATKEDQYHLYMLEIELVNRMYRQKFKESAFKFGLMPHCLRDFRDCCQSEEGDIDQVCMGCTDECFINMGSHLMKDYGIEPYISVEMDQEKQFKEIKQSHESVGALGIACVPELARGMRLCIKLGISPVGIPLDANRCARWLKQAEENSFSLDELEELLR